MLQNVIGVRMCVRSARTLLQCADTSRAPLNAYGAPPRNMTRKGSANPFQQCLHFWSCLWRLLLELSHSLSLLLSVSFAFRNHE